MTMIACRECGKDVSDEAKLCPHCGVKVHDRIFWPWVFLAVCLMVSAFMLFATFRKPEPGEVDRRTLSGAIDLCWQSYNKKSNTPSEARSLAAICEQMTSDYEEKYKSKP